MTEQPGATFVVTDGETVSGTIEGLWFQCAAKTWAAIEAAMLETPDPADEPASTQVRT